LSRVDIAASPQKTRRRNCSTRLFEKHTKIQTKPIKPDASHFRRTLDCQASAISLLTKNPNPHMIMDNTEYKPLTIGNWIGTMFLLAIPLVNIIMLIVWAATGSTHPSKKSFAQAYLIFIGAIFVIAIAAAMILPFFAHLPKA
jgi:hypothetical protein